MQIKMHQYFNFTRNCNFPQKMHNFMTKSFIFVFLFNKLSIYILKSLIFSKVSIYIWHYLQATKSNFDNSDPESVQNQNSPQIY